MLHNESLLCSMLEGPRSFTSLKRLCKRWAALCLICLVLPASVLGAAERFRAGMPLTEALLQLQREGLKLVFSSQVVRPEMKVQTAPQSQNRRQTLRELLAPHGLDVSEGPNEVFVVVPSRTASKPGDPAPASSAAPAVHVSETIVVQPSQISVLVEEPAAPVSLSRQQIAAVPHLGEDVTRALRLLPGTSSTDLSAELSLRGGRGDELLILLDGQELYEPYHLKDFDNALSIVGTSVLERVNLITAAFPVGYGDRMAGVMNMVTVSPPDRRRLRLSVDLLGARIEAGDTYADGRVGWIGSLRRGTTQILGRALDREEPNFWDFFGKVDARLTARQGLRLHGLLSTDSLNFPSDEDVELDADQEPRRLNTRYENSYVWLTHRAILRDDLFVDTTASATWLRRNRRGFEEDEERSFDVRDRRRLNVTGAHQSWNFAATPRQFLNAGIEYQNFDALFDYLSEREFATSLAQIRSQPREGVFAFHHRFASERFSIYASDRLFPTRTLTVELGVRYDRQSLVQDNLLSPRLNAAWALGTGSVVRMGWGYFSQSHRTYELMVEDGDTTVYPVERSQHWVLGFEHLFSQVSFLPLSSVRVEGYQRRVSNPRPRYQNLFEPFDAFPEGQFDRVRIEPQSATAEGGELMLRGRSARRFDWWLNYAFASTTDRIDGTDVPRSIDQQHALNVDLNYHLGRDWNLNLAWVYRTGRPTTPLSLDAEGRPVLGPLNSRRFPHYQRMDLRLGRDWQMRSGTLTFFLDVHNLYDQLNISGFDVKLDPETGALTFDPEHFPRLFASAGISWEFR